MSYVSMELSFASLSVKSSVLNNLFGLSPGHRNISIHLVFGSHNIKDFSKTTKQVLF